MQTPFRSCLILAAYAFASAGPARALAAGLTARGALPEVLAKARAWQGDAALVHLSSTKVNPDGTASEWKYSFYASASKKRCVVTAHPGGVTLREVRLGSFTEPLGEFVDSDKAMEVARKNGLRGGEPSMSVLRPAGARAEGTRWLVTGGFNAGDTSIGVDAKTGAFLERSVMGKD
jgi:hypothetical protein